MAPLRAFSVRTVLITGDNALTAADAGLDDYVAEATPEQQLELILREQALAEPLCIALLRRNLAIYGLGGLLLPFVAIKGIDLGLSLVM